MRIAFCVVVTLVCTLVGLQSASTADESPSSFNAIALHDGKNAIEAVQAVAAGGGVMLKIMLRWPLEGQIRSFSVSNPARVVIDIPRTINASGKSAHAIDEGDVRNVTLTQATEKTRVIVNLLRLLAHETKVDGREVTVVLYSRPLSRRRSPSAAAGAEALGEAGLAGDKARPILAELCGAFRFAVDCAAADLDGRMATIEPAAFKLHEGKSIGGQQQVRRVRETRSPMRSSVFKAVEGFDAANAEYPVITPRGH